MIHNLSLLDGFFHDNGQGELVRDKTPRGNWFAHAKDVRLARGYVLKATCRRRFLGYNRSFLELSEKEVSDYVGPQAIRLVSTREDEFASTSSSSSSSVLLSPHIEVPFGKTTLQALDAIVGNADGALVRGGRDFSSSCSEATLSRATLLVASLPVRDTGAINLCVVLLEEAELKVLRHAEEKRQAEQAEALLRAHQQQQQKKEEEEEDAAAEISTRDKVAAAAAASLDALRQHRRPPSAPAFSLFSCCMAKPPPAPAAASPATTTTTRQAADRAGSIATKKSTVGGGGGIASKPSAANVAAEHKPSLGGQRHRRALVIGTAPTLPPLHKELVDRTIQLMGQAASSDTYDASWRRVGSLDGLTWLMKDGGKMLMVRGTIRAPARCVFDFMWNQDEESALVGIEPRIEHVVSSSKEEDGASQLKFYHKTTSREWQMAALHSDAASPSSSVQILKHYYVHADGTIFVAEIAPQCTGGLVISPATQDTCHVAWVEIDQQHQHQQQQQQLAPWATSRMGTIQTKLLGDRLHNLRQFGLAEANFDAAIRMGNVVNFNGTSDAEEGGEEDDSASFSHQMRARENNFIANRQRGDLALVKSQVERALEFVQRAIPEERQRFRSQFDQFARGMREGFLESPRFLLLKNGAQYPFDCIMMWLLTNLPTQESWVEALAEQLSMKNVEAQSAYGRSEMHSGNEIQSRLSQILKTTGGGEGRDERVPSL